MVKVTIGIDPGVKGGIAIFRDGELFNAITMPSHKNPDKKFKVKNLISYDEIVGVLMGHGVGSVKKVFIEKAFMPTGQAGASYMQNYGMILGICIGLGLLFVEISPKEWQASQLDIKDCFKTRKDGTPIRDKAVSVRTVNKLYPELTLKNNQDGIADAILIARHGINILHE